MAQTARCFGYIRNSTEDQKESPEVQKREILGRYPTVSEFFHDDGVSGAAGIEKRPALTLLLRTVKKGDMIVVAKRDRLARDSFLSCWLDKEATVRGFRIEKWTPKIGQ